MQAKAKRKVITLTRPVKGEKQNPSGNPEILPGIGRRRIFSKKFVIVLRYRRQEAGH